MITIVDRHARGPRVRIVSERTDPSIAKIRVLADSNIKRARSAYSSTFGFEVKDKRIDRQVAELLSVALVEGRKKVQLPIEVALALWLREGGAGRRVGALPEMPWSDKNRILERVRARKLKLQNDEGYAAGRALTKAAEELTPGPEFSVDTIIERIRHPSGKRKKAKAE
jgi:hypothetical protein